MIMVIILGEIIKIKPQSITQNFSTCRRTLTIGLLRWMMPGRSWWAYKEVKTSILFFFEICV
ncbi:hypothetical protein AMJ44_00690 [candidate division WOR-1 bacterium DG_54_3]|uniref:Uncharacterized protein n=1 Tax=candidate division WOR-1 bacterium DG_54_3 TaxID=1703775 RepID=A0A0S7Y6I2_UNCSA|nr:MAG: hypothetical protein AMJ44_00690 [candidate division WOR-1 bacterium DG_54_3]